MRDAIVQGELLVMRMLKFEVTMVHPHKVTEFQSEYLRKRGWVLQPELDGFRSLRIVENISLFSSARCQFDTQPVPLAECA